MTFIYWRLKSCVRPVADLCSTVAFFIVVPLEGDSPSPREDSYNTEFTPIALLRPNKFGTLLILALLSTCWHLDAIVIALLRMSSSHLVVEEEQSSVDTQTPLRPVSTISSSAALLGIAIGNRDDDSAVITSRYHCGADVECPPCCEMRPLAAV